MTCVNCGAPMRLDVGKGLMVCDYCLSEAVPPMGEDGVQIAGETRHHCPTCEETLADGMIDRNSILYCRNCRGMLVSIERFLPLVEHMRQASHRPAVFLPPRNAHDAERVLDCPLCGQAMHGHLYGGPGNVHIDTCETCSMIWLDRNELQRVVVAPDPRPVYSRHDDEVSTPLGSTATGWDGGGTREDNSPWSFGGPSDWD